MRTQLVLALFVALQPLVKFEKLRADPKGQGGMLLVVEHSLGPLHQVTKIEIELLVLGPQNLRLAVEGGGAPTGLGRDARQATARFGGGLRHLELFVRVDQDFQASAGTNAPVPTVNGE